MARWKAETDYLNILPFRPLQICPSSCDQKWSLTTSCVVHPLTLYNTKPLKENSGMVHVLSQYVIPHRLCRIRFRSALFQKRTFFLFRNILFVCIMFPGINCSYYNRSDFRLKDCCIYFQRVDETGVGFKTRVEFQLQLFLPRVIHRCTR